MKWGPYSIAIQTDSAIKPGEQKVQTKEVTKTLLKCHQGVLGELIVKFSLKLNEVFVPSEGNKTDILTRVQKRTG